MTDEKENPVLLLRVSEFVMISAFTSISIENRESMFKGRRGFKSIDPIQDSTT
jgi:hypothetical protein